MKLFCYTDENKELAYVNPEHIALVKLMDPCENGTKQVVFILPSGRIFPTSFKSVEEFYNELEDYLGE